jgi:hypothetical protein
MLDYILLNKKKAWGLVIFFLAIFIVLSIVNRTPFDFGLQKIWTNIVMSLALSFFGYLVFLFGAFIDYSRATDLFASAPFKLLLDKGFKTELTAVKSRFLFAGKRIAGTVDGFPVKIGGSAKRFSIFIGVHENITDRRTQKELADLLKPKGLKFDEIFVETLVVPGTAGSDNGYVLHLLEDRIAFLKVNGFEPRD